MSTTDAAVNQKMIVLKSSDGQIFEVAEAVAVESLTIKHMIEEDCANTTIPVPNVTSKILAMVIEYCKRHVEAAAKGKTVDGDAAAKGKTVDGDAAAKGKTVDGDAAVVTDKTVDENLKKLDAEFVKNVDQPILFDLILAANYLNIRGLLDLTCQSAADMIMWKTPEEIRTIFGIKNDFTAEEEAEVRLENKWAFE